ncbi:MAG: hypothetical protein ACPHUL_00080 [Marinomonas gallaica]
MGLLDFAGGIVSGALGLITKAVTWLVDIPDQKSKGVTVERQGSDHPIPVVYGKRKAGAIKVHKYVTDSPDLEAWNDTLHLICVFAEGEVDGLETLYLNGVKSTDPKFSGGNFGGKWFSVDFYNGAEGQPASAAAVSGIPNWTIDHRLDGLCYAYLKLEMPTGNKQVWSGEPDVQAVIRGKKVLDTRTGVVAYSENGAMCLRDYLTNPIYGKGLPESFIDKGSFELVANACDQTVDSTITKTVYITNRENPGFPYQRATTTTQKVSLPRFSCNIVIDTSQDYINNIRELLSSFRGIVQDLTGSAKITYETTLQEQYGVSETAFRFTSDDLVGGVDHDGGSISERFNVVEVRFPNEAKDYEMDSVFYPEDSDPLRAQWLDEDGGKDQPESIEVDSITSKADALQMAEIIAKKSRFTRSASFTGMPWTIQVEVGDVIGLDSNMNGWTDKPFRVVEKRLNEDDTVDFTVEEHEDAVYPWSGRSFDELVGGTWLGDPDDMPPVTGLSITPDLTLSRTGTLTWQTPANAWIRRYEVVIKDAADDIIFDVDVIGNAYDVPLLDAGAYTAYVYSISQTGSRSPSAAIGITLAAPVAPTSISINVRDWEIEALPQLAGIGLGTVFEFDITQGDGTGYTPSSKARASSYPFTGLLPDTLHTVYARAINAYGTSGWTSTQATTTNTGAQIGAVLDPIRDELDQYSPMTVPQLPDIATAFSGIYDNYKTNEELNNERKKTEIIAGQVNDPQNNTSAMFSFVQQAETKADGAARSTTSLLSGITGEEDQAQAISILEAYANEGGLGARAFFGTDVNDRVTGIVIGDSGSEQSIDFLSGSARFFDNNGDAQIYFDVANNRYVFSGEIIANTGTFSGNVSSATITGGSINIGGGDFVVNSSGELTAKSANLTGGLRTAGGTTNRVEVGVAGSPYDIWLGSGTRNDTNGVLWVKPNGTGFIKGEFFEGEIIETKSASNTFTSGSPWSVTASGHSSSGKAVRVDFSSSFEANFNGNQTSNSYNLTCTVKRGSTTIGSRVFYNAPTFYDSLNDQTLVNINGAAFVVDTLSASGSRDYTLQVVINGPGTFTSPETSLSIYTLENKLES